MKRIIFSMLAIATMASCSSEEVQNQDSKTPVPIKLTSRVLEVESKAAIQQGDAFEAQILNILKSDYTDALTQVASFSADGTTTLGTTWYYPIDAETNAKLIGYAPKDEASKVVRSNNNVTFTIDGSQDVMTTSETVGNRNTGTLKLSFEHKLTQIKFAVKVKDPIVNSDMTITSITMKNVENSIAIKLSPISTIAYSDPIDLPVTLPDGLTTTSLTDTGKDAGIMMVPEKAKYTIDIATNKGNFEGIEISPKTGNFLPSKSHVITLTFTAKEVSTSAETGEWIAGENNDLDIK